MDKKNVHAYAQLKGRNIVYCIRVTICKQKHEKAIYWNRKIVYGEVNTLT